MTDPTTAKRFADLVGVSVADYMRDAIFAGVTGDVATEILIATWNGHTDGSIELCGEVIGYAAGVADALGISRDAVAHVLADCAHGYANDVAALAGRED